MKGSLLLPCACACLVLLLLPIASATCYPPVVQTPITTYIPPGPHGSILVESSPTGAIISINGVNQGHAPVTLRDLWPGSYRITATMDGYEEYTTTTTISGPTLSSVYCPLVPLSTGNLIRISSSPASAGVYLDGDFRGQTPLTLGSPVSGSHTIRLTLDGYNDWKTTIDASAGGPTTLSVTMVPGSSSEDKGLNVTSDPAGATVMLDGVARGKTPLMLNSLAAGIHILEIEASGYIPWKSTVDIPERGIKIVSVTLNPKNTVPPGWITVFSAPSDARVSLDGTYVGRTPANRSLNLDAIPAGEHTVALELSGYPPYSARVTVSPNQVTTVNAVLAPDSGSRNGALAVTSDPAGATVIIDNTTRGISPFTAQDIPAGSHEVRLTRDGCEDYSTSIHGFRRYHQYRFCFPQGSTTHAENTGVSPDGSSGTGHYQFPCPAETCIILFFAFSFQASQDRCQKFTPKKVQCT